MPNMTAFITRFSASSDSAAAGRAFHSGGWRCWLLAFFVALLPLTAIADEGNEIRYAEIVAVNKGYFINADIDLQLNERLIEAISRGISLYFTAEFRLERPRWYWFNEVMLERQLEYRLSYHTITRSYRLSVGSLHQNFDTLDAAVRTMLSIRNWRVADSSRLLSGTSYRAALRMRLDTSMLPKPFQVTAIGSSDWNVSTDWQRWTFLAGAVK